MRSELLPDGHGWLRIADPRWSDPLDPSFGRRGGRWNPPNSFPVLSLNQDLVTCRLNLRSFIAGWPYQPEDLNDRSGPVLVEAVIPRAQRVADIHSQMGLVSAGLSTSYPLDGRGRPIGHDRCQPIGREARRLGLRGVRCRSARAPDGAGRELAWFPASRRSRARAASIRSFESWYYP